MKLRFTLLAVLAVVGTNLPVSRAATAILETNIDRPLRYTPDGTDFVITNGPESFNRAMFTNSAFRVNGGDKPEFVLYLPGRGGNLRFGLLAPNGASKWLNDAAQIITRYHPGSLQYEIADPLLGDKGKLNLTAMVLPTGQGLIVRVDTVDAPNVRLVWGFGGANGVSGNRGGDIGTENQPLTRYFQLQPGNCAGDTFDFGAGSFSMQFRAAAARTGAATTIRGIVPGDAKFALANASQWNSLASLLSSGGVPGNAPVLLGQAALASGKPIYLALQRLPQAGENLAAELPVYVEAGGAPPAETAAAVPANPASPLNYTDLPRVFAAAEARRNSLANRVVIDTPDPYLNAAMAALCVAADGIWDEAQGVFMHGAVAWRSRLLGWRGPYTGDELGWFDREVRHLTYWAGQQNTRPIGPVGGPDPAAAYARAEPAVFSNGIISKSVSHYDMNIVYIDQVFRHLLWTGDLNFAKQEWPVIQRHLAWEQRLFRRVYPGDLPLYEAYNVIWASDALGYSGGGAAHSTAFNYFHNLMAARIATMIGEDPVPYQREAELIREGMKKYLWLGDRGWYAEYKDWLGLQLVHSSAALWTFYHTIDENITTPQEAWQMSRYVDTEIPHIPIRGAGVPTGFYTLATSNWMPYTWSLNNVVMGETAHTALAYWEANRSEEAFKILKGCLLDSMYLGQVPGDVGTMTYYDANRGESQSDFGDDIGAVSRTFMEGLFGVHPDALAGELVLRPGFPAAWDHASLHHPALDYAYHLIGPVVISKTVDQRVETGSGRGVMVTQKETVQSPGYAEDYTITPHFAKPMALKLQTVARRTQIASITVNGQPAQWRVLEDSVETPRVEISSPAAAQFDIHIVWTGDPPENPTAPTVAALGRDLVVPLGKAQMMEINDPQGAINNFGVTPATFTATAVGTPGFRTAFLKVHQGDLFWVAPLSFEIRSAFEIIPAESQDAAQVRFTVRNNTTTAFDREVTLHVGGRTTTTHLLASAVGESAEISLDAAGLLPGANLVSIDLGGNQTVQGVVQCWKRMADPAKTHFEPLDLSLSFNDQVTQIFGKNKYLSPRSPFPSLSLPAQGLGSWDNITASFTVDDSGLRAAAAQGNGVYTLPDQGVPFRTPGDAESKNILFTSQWDNYPRSAEVPLTGKAAHVYLLMAGSTNTMQTRMDNGEVVVTYVDCTTIRMALDNPTTWWPIDQNYFIDDFAFRRPDTIPPRVDLATGRERTVNLADYKGRGGRLRNGGEATVLDIPLDPAKELKSLTVHAIANDVVIGLMAATLVR